MASRSIRPVFVCLIAAMLASAGCRAIAPVAIPKHNYRIAPELIEHNEKPIEIGAAQPIIDKIGWVIGIPDKILLWDRRVSRHKISAPTLLTTAEYLEANNLPHVKVRANQYAPLEDFKRLPKNKTVAWPYRYTLGVLSVAGEAIFPGRVFGGDHFNPFTQTVHLYSDVPAIALHELGHAKDFTRRKWQGTYALVYNLVPLWHETNASQDAFAYLQERGDQQGLMEANRILYPAYGTYVGGAIGDFVPDYALPIYAGAVIAGHINGRLLNRQAGPAATGYQHASLEERRNAVRLAGYDLGDHDYEANNLDGNAHFAASEHPIIASLNAAADFNQIPARTEFNWLSNDNALIADATLVEDAPLRR